MRLCFLVASLVVGSLVAGCGQEDSVDAKPLDLVASGDRSTKRAEDQDDVSGTTPGGGSVEDERARYEESAGTAAGTGAGADGGAGSTPAPAPAPAPPPPVATVRLDGVVQKVTEVRLWAPNADGEANVFIKFEGAGAPVGTDVNITFVKVAKGCVASPKPKPQDLWLRPPGTGDQFHSADGAACGLDITSFPAAVGGVAEGSFKGSVAGINGAAGKTRALDITFKATRVR